ncbi:MAG TPA: hypothetical protein VKQ29_06735 [Aliidongia sp.]|nr:hypothetical protein [Aliidongia sp.]
MHAKTSRRFSLSKGLGLELTSNGLTLAGVPLLRRAAHGFVARDELEIVWLLDRAYGAAIDSNRTVKGLQTVARALTEDQPIRAMIRALLLHLPELDWAGAARLAQADDMLAKFDPDQPRDEKGRWAANGNEPVPAPGIHGLPPKLSRPPLRLVSDSPLANQNEAHTHADTSSDDPEAEPWVTLPPGKRIDELGDLLEWVANVKPEEAPIIRGEIKRLYYDHGDTRGGDALNLALTDALEATSPAERADILERFEPYTREDPSQAAMDSYGLTTGVGLGQALAATLAGPAATQWLDPNRGTRLFSEDFWQMAPLKRGDLLHQARSPQLAPNFPVIDDKVGSLVISTKTLDLSAAGYQVPRRLEQMVNNYVDRVAGFYGRRWGDVEIEAKDITDRQLDLIIPRNFSTQAQWDILRSAKSRAEARGVHLRITRV